MKSIDFELKDLPWTSCYNMTWDWRKDAYGSRKIVATNMARTGINDLIVVLYDAFKDLDNATS